MTRLNRFLLPPTILLLSVGFSKGEEGRRKIHVLDLPRVMSEGSIPGNAQTESYFFLDEASGDLILVFPTDLSEANFGTPSGEARTSERVKLAIGVRPTVETRIARDAGFSYEYRVGNEPQATQRIGKWVLATPDLGDRVNALTMKGPPGWGFETREIPDEWVEDRLSVMNLIPGAKAVTADDLVRKQASWWYRGLGGATLEPGECCRSFIVRSQYLPGILTAYFQGTPHHAWTTASVPHVLSRLVPAFNFIETNSVTMPVVGPKFEPTTLVQTRVCDIVHDLKRLVDEGRMKTTPFTEGLVPLVPDCLDGNPAKFASVVEAIAGRAENRFEIEILLALKMNLAIP